MECVSLDVRFLLSFNITMNMSFITLYTDFNMQQRNYTTAT